MANPRQRRKVKNPILKVSRRPKATKRKEIDDPNLAIHWDSNRTLEQNYKKLGLAYKINSDIGKRATRQNLEEWNYKRQTLFLQNKLDAFDSEDEITKELEQIFAKNPVPTQTNQVIEELENKAKVIFPSKTPRPLSKDKQNYINALIAKYGEDYGRMFMDIKLNRLQLTAHQLKRLASRL